MKYFIILSTMCFSFSSYARPDDYAKKLCRTQPDMYKCVKHKFPGKYKNTTWEKLYPKNYSLLQTINRRNTAIWQGHTIAEPRNPDRDFLSFSPFDRNRTYEGKVVYVNLNELAWGAYENGKLINWNAANGGSKRCKETGKMTCKTPVGTFKVIRKATKRITRSQLYPVECKNKRKCGFAMLWFTQIFRDGAGLHGARFLSGANLSHGCVRVMSSRYVHHFIDKDTLIIIENY